MNGPKIYIASKTRHKDKWIALRSKGYNINSGWIDVEMVNDRRKLAIDCVKDCQQCDALVLYAEPEDHLKDALVEVGIVLGLGKDVFIVGDSPSIGNTIIEHPNVMCMVSVEQALEYCQLTK